MSDRARLSPAELLQLRRLTTPTVFNGWEQVTRHDPTADAFNIEPATDFMPQFGPMVGYAVTAVIGFGDGSVMSDKTINAWGEFRQYVASTPGPKVVVVQDTSKPRVLGSMWGEVGATIYRNLGCVGTITDGGVRDLAEMTTAGFKAMARRLCVGHGYGTILRWNCDVDVFGRTVRPGQLIHADQHGFLAIPPEDESRLFEATLFMDRNEAVVLAAAQNVDRLPQGEHLKRIDDSINAFIGAARDKYGRDGEKH
jgi:4-hydroxy-4-methyl-2-oxoglutarate aldolase